MNGLAPSIYSWPGLMTKDQAAAYWSMSPRKFSECVAEGIISGRKIGPRTIRYSRAEMDDAAEKLPVGRGDSPSQV